MIPKPGLGRSKERERERERDKDGRERLPKTLDKPPQRPVDVIQNKKQPTNEEERIYLKFTEYFDEVIKKQKIKQKDPNILFNGMEDPPGTRQYPKEMIDKLNTEYEKESYFEWVDDWKYR